MNSGNHPCELCSTPGGEVLWNSPTCRVVRVDDPYYPGFCRVIWNAHVREMSDLDSGQQHYLMSVVFAVEVTIRTLYSPDKINLASFGNMVPHVHWHIIPRWTDDRHFPAPIWGEVSREGLADRPVVSSEDLAKALSVALLALKH
ncbi:MAG: HIT family protein [Azonexus sp.]|nr:HIT family protein [Azonexus sp.]